MASFTITFVLFTLIIIIIIRSVLKFLNYIFIMNINYKKNIFRAGVTNFSRFPIKNFM